MGRRYREARPGHGVGWEGELGDDAGVVEGEEPGAGRVGGGEAEGAVSGSGGVAEPAGLGRLGWRREAVAVVCGGLLGVGADDEAGWSLEHGFWFIVNG